MLLTMAWPSLIGHQQIVDRFRRRVKNGRLGSAFLFVGPAGIGKHTFALNLAQALLCESTAPDLLDACQTCSACQQVAARTHPDLLLIGKPDDRSFIPVELFIGDREHRMRTGLCHDISLKPFQGAAKVAVIDDADYLNAEGANCLLKTLEEPPADSLLILIGTSQHRQLPTIRSRCQIIRFSPLSDAQMEQVLREQVLREQPGFDDESTLPTTIAQSQGSVQRALQWADPEVIAARDALIDQLAQQDFDSIALTKATSQAVDAAGKDAPLRRVRLRLLVQAAIEYYRGGLQQLITDQSTTESDGDPSGSLRISAIQATTDCIENCLQTAAQVDANANLQSLIAAWIDDLAQLSLAIAPCVA